jgi:hypothetical protein
MDQYVLWVDDLQPASAIGDGICKKTNLRTSWNLTRRDEIETGGTLPGNPTFDRLVGSQRE